MRIDRPDHVPNWPRYAIREMDDGWFAWTRVGLCEFRSGLAGNPDEAFEQLLAAAPVELNGAVLPRVLAEQLDRLERRDVEIAMRGIDVRLTRDDIQLICELLRAEDERVAGDMPGTRRRKKEWLVVLEWMRNLSSQLRESHPGFVPYEGFDRPTLRWPAANEMPPPAPDARRGEN